MSHYVPPYQITTAILNRVAEISERLGRWSASHNNSLSPHLRRDNRIKTIQASLAIENNTLSLEQVTAVLDGKRVLGLPHEIQEVRNAFIAYEKLNDWQADNINHLLAAHHALMAGLLDDAGQFRSGGVGIYRGKELVHMAPPANRVPVLMQQLLNWLKTTDLHPLIASCIFHYEFEFIHPFADGNGRMGRLWQTLILSRWQPILAYLPVETVIRNQQQLYYTALQQADKSAEATPFIGFMLDALFTAMVEVVESDTASSEKNSDKSSEKILQLLAKTPTLSAKQLAQQLGLSSRAIEKNIAQLKADGRLKRIGAAKGGYWQVCDF
jgi:Fic family protein